MSGIVTSKASSQDFISKLKEGLILKLTYAIRGYPLKIVHWRAILALTKAGYNDQLALQENLSAKSTSHVSEIALQSCVLNILISQVLEFRLHYENGKFGKKKIDAITLPVKKGVFPYFIFLKTSVVPATYK